MTDTPNSLSTERISRLVDEGDSAKAVSCLETFHSGTASVRRDALATVQSVLERDATPTGLANVPIRSRG